MKAVTIRIAVLALISMASAAAQYDTLSAPLQPAPERTLAADFALRDLSGKTANLKQYRGKVVLLDFWATWCTGCKQEIPWFVEFQNKYGKDGLQVVGVSIDDTVEKLKPYVANAKMNYIVLQGLDHDDVQDAFGPMFGIPVTAVISRDGRICAKHVGLSSKDAFEREIKSLL